MVIGIVMSLYPDNIWQGPAIIIPGDSLHNGSRRGDISLLQSALSLDLLHQHLYHLIFDVSLTGSRAGETGTGSQGLDLKE